MTSTGRKKKKYTTTTTSTTTAAGQYNNSLAKGYLSIYGGIDGAGGGLSGWRREEGLNCIEPALRGLSLQKVENPWSNVSQNMLKVPSLNITTLLPLFFSRPHLLTKPIISAHAHTHTSTRTHAHAQTHTHSPISTVQLTKPTSCPCTNIVVIPWRPQRHPSQPKSDVILTTCREGRGRRESDSSVKSRASFEPLWCCHLGQMQDLIENVRKFGVNHCVIQ